MLEGLEAAPHVEKWTEEDGTMINELADSMKQLRRLEKDIFPKPVETLVAVPNADPNSPTTQPTPVEGESGDLNENTPAEDTGAGH